VKHFGITLSFVILFISALSISASAAGKSLEVVSGGEQPARSRGPEKMKLSYERVCLGGLEFVAVIGPLWGGDYAISPTIVQVIDTSGRPKSCK